MISFVELVTAVLQTLYYKIFLNGIVNIFNRNETYSFFVMDQTNSLL